MSPGEPGPPRSCRPPDDFMRMWPGYNAEQAGWDEGGLTRDARI